MQKFIVVNVSDTETPHVLKSLLDLRPNWSRLTTNQQNVNIKKQKPIENTHKSIQVYKNDIVNFTDEWISIQKLRS